MTNQGRPTFDDAVIRAPLKSLCTYVENSSERSFPMSLSRMKGLKQYVVATIKISRNTWDAARYLCVDEPIDQSLKRDYFLAAFPLARTILELLFSFVLIFDNPATNALWYFQSGWREDYNEQQRRKKRYNNQETWKDFLAQREDSLIKLATELGITPSMRENINDIKRWPNPGKMANIVRDPKRKELFEFLNEWYYHPLSAASHLTGPGMIPAMHLLTRGSVTGPYAFTPELYKSEVIGTLNTLIVAILSECIIEMGLQKANDAKYIWTLLSDISPYVKDLYQLRYQSLLQDKDA